MNKEKPKLKKLEKNFSPEELLDKYYTQLAFLQMKNKTGQLLKTNLIKKTKKDIARILTKQNQSKTSSHKQ